MSDAIQNQPKPISETTDSSSVCPKALVHSTESFGSVDGPGVRYVIFLQGCNMRCRYCHNVDTWDKHSENVKTADELLATALRYKSYWGKEGGITVSGGEPLLQIDFLLDLFRKAKEKNVKTCLDTALQPFTKEEPFFSKFQELMEYTDLLLCDIKHIDPEKHLALTAQKNDNILEGLSYLSEINKPIWIRHVLVPGISDDETDLKNLRTFINTLNNVERVEILPYHSMGVYKWEELGIPYTLKDVNPPSEETIKKAEAILL